MWQSLTEMYQIFCSEFVSHCLIILHITLIPSEVLLVLPGGYDDMIYLLTAIGLSPNGSSTVHIYTHTIHRTIQNKQYIEQHNNFGRVRTVPRLG